MRSKIKEVLDLDKGQVIGLMLLVAAVIIISVSVKVIVRNMNEFSEEEYVEEVENTEKIDKNLF
ncbi:MAG: hypothetical protein R3Y26_11065 [Rikenellaceae bacterium]